MSINFFGRIRRQYITTMIVIGHLVNRHRSLWQDLGNLFFHLTIMHCRPGTVYFQVDQHEADGAVCYIVVDEDGRHHIHEMTFRIDNRWMARNNRHCATSVVWSIETAASVNQGVRVHSVVWGNEVFRRREVKAFDISRLPSDEVIAKRHQLMRAADALRQKISTVKEDNTTYGERVASQIILRT